jgi:hypothetical protein
MAVKISLLRAHAPSVHSAAGGGMMRRDNQRRACAPMA